MALRLTGRAARVHQPRRLRHGQGRFWQLRLAVRLPALPLVKCVPRSIGCVRCVDDGGRSLGGFDLMVGDRLVRRGRRLLGLVEYLFGSVDQGFGGTNGAVRLIRGDGRGLCRGSGLLGGFDRMSRRALGLTPLLEVLGERSSGSPPMPRFRGQLDDAIQPVRGQTARWTTDGTRDCNEVGPTCRPRGGWVGRMEAHA
jgi:hypothetical protein